MFEQTFKNIDDVLWKEAGCTTELDYTKQASWLLFLKYLDDLEQERAIEAELAGKPYEFIIDDLHLFLANFATVVFFTSKTWDYISPKKAKILLVK